MKKIVFFIITILSNHLYAQVITNVEIIKENKKYYATNIKINGQKIDGIFLIDTGSESYINIDLAQQLGLEIQGVDSVSDGYTTTSIQFTYADFTVNDILFKNIKVNIDKIGILSDFKCNIKGVIGNNLMRYFVWRFSKDSIQIIRKTKHYKHIKEYKKGKLQRNTYYPTLITTFGRPRATTLFDTGDNGFFEISESLLKYVPKKEIRVGKGISSYRAFTEDTSAIIVKTDIFKILDFQLDNPIAFVSNEDYNFSLGAEFLDFFDIILDFPKGKYYVRQNVKDYTSDYWNTYGFKFKIENNSAVIIMIWNNSQAEKQNIQLGDEILLVNNLNIHDIMLNNPKCEVYKLIAQELEKHEIDITIINIKGTKRKLHLKQQYLFEQ